MARAARAALGIVVLGAMLVGAVPAVAAPRVWVEGVMRGEQFGRGGVCLSPGAVVAINGRGFAPRSTVALGRRRFKTGATGDFGFLLSVDAPTRGAQEEMRLRFRQGARSATLRYWAAIDGVLVPSWANGAQVADATNGKAEKVRAGGFGDAIGKALYVHYVLDGRQVFAQRVARRIQAPCGAAEFTMRQFPFAGAPGAYTVDFSANARYDSESGSGYATVYLDLPPRPFPAPSTIFTVAGTSSFGPLGDGGPATGASIAPDVAVAALPDDGFLLTDRGRIRRVDASGRITTVAGTGTPGSTGDGGPATSASIEAGDITVMPDGGFLTSECDAARVRRVTPDGVIRTIAGTGKTGFAGDGGQATAAQLACPKGTAVLPDGSIAVADSANDRVRRIAPDGLITTIAGTGRVGGEQPAAGPATTLNVGPADVLAQPDGSLLIADEWFGRVLRLDGGALTTVAGDGGEGAVADDGRPARDVPLTPLALAAAPGGGFYVVDLGFWRIMYSEPRLRRVLPDGTIYTVAGTGRFAPTPTRQEEQRGDGMPGPTADLRPLADVAVLTGGGVLFTDGRVPFIGATLPGLVHLLPGPDGGPLAVALRRDRDRIFAPGTAAGVHVALTAPADVTLTITDGDRQIAERHAALPAGESQVDIGTLPGNRPLTASVSASDSAGRIAQDQMILQPRGWLNDVLARTVAGGPFGNQVFGCRRLAAGRVDCSLGSESCQNVMTVQLGTDGRLRLGTYSCPIQRTPRPPERLHAWRSSDFSCDISDTSCPPDLSGRVADRWLLPWG